MQRKRKIAACVLVAGICVLAQPSAAGEFPDRPIRLVVSHPPSGYGDTIARIVAEGLAVRSGATVIVDNQGSASGTNAAVNVARAAPDNAQQRQQPRARHGPAPSRAAYGSGPTAPNEKPS